MAERDAVDVIVGQWRSERPDLDPSAKEITGRVIRLSALFQQALADEFAPLGINGSDHGLLTALRRSGSPFALSPTELARQRMMTSGGMTAAIDRLERKGLVARSPHPTDRRGAIVGLTADGVAVIDRAMERQVEVEQRLVAALSERDRAQLVSLLRRLLLSVDDS